MAPYVSTKSAEICKASSIGYMDLSGNCRIAFDTVYIEQQGRPNQFTEKRDMRYLYSAKGERMLRVLLNNPKKVWKLVDIARESNISLGWASKIKDMLKNSEWLSIVDKGFYCSNPKETLEEWSRNFNPRKNIKVLLYTMESISDTEAMISSFCEKNNIRYAFTGFSGAIRLAPAVRYNSVTLYADEKLLGLIDEIGLKKVDFGANVRVVLPYDEGVYYGLKTVDEAKVVSPIQLYLDLIKIPGRGEEAAKALMENVIKFE